MMQADVALGPKSGCGPWEARQSPRRPSASKRQCRPGQRHHRKHGWPLFVQFFHERGVIRTFTESFSYVSDDFGVEIRNELHVSSMAIVTTSPSSPDGDPQVPLWEVALRVLAISGFRMTVLSGRRTGDGLAS